MSVELGWARKSRIKVEEQGEEGSAQMEAGSGYDCDDEDGCEASGEDRGKSLVHTHIYTYTRTHTCCLCVWCGVLMLQPHWSLANRDKPRLEGKSVLQNRFPPSFFLYIPPSLSTFPLVSLVSAGSFLPLLSSMIKDALTSRSPQKEKIKNYQ